MRFVCVMVVVFCTHCPTGSRLPVPVGEETHWFQSPSISGWGDSRKRITSNHVLSSFLHSATAKRIKSGEVLSHKPGNRLSFKFEDEVSKDQQDVIPPTQGAELTAGPVGILQSLFSMASLIFHFAVLSWFCLALHVKVLKYTVMRNHLHGKHFQFGQKVFVYFSI